MHFSGQDLRYGVRLLGEGPGVHRRRAAHPGARHGRRHRHFQRGGHGAAEAVAVSRPGASAGDLGEEPLAKSLQDVRRAGQFPGVAKAEPRRGADGGDPGHADQPHRRPQRTHRPGGTQGRARLRRPVPAARRAASGGAHVPARGRSAGPRQLRAAEPLLVAAPLRRRPGHRGQDDPPARPALHGGGCAAAGFRGDGDRRRCFRSPGAELRAMRAPPTAAS